jgi:hypothetical protein
MVEDCSARVPAALLGASEPSACAAAGAASEPSAGAACSAAGTGREASTSCWSMDMRSCWARICRPTVAAFFAFALPAEATIASTISARHDRPAATSARLTLPSVPRPPPPAPLAP